MYKDRRLHGISTPNNLQPEIPVVSGLDYWKHCRVVTSKHTNVNNILNTSVENNIGCSMVRS